MADANEKYEELKRYSENLSHELLTPLTVIRSKAELLLQSENLSESDLNNIDVILKTVGKLSRLNRGLILLSKIKNDQFIDREEILLSEVISESLELMEDQIRHSELSIRIDLKSPTKIYSNSNLVHILFNNLIKNACIHNVKGGYIKVSLFEDKVIIENSGLRNEKSESDLFHRFTSGDDRVDSLGLGLSIVKNICEKLQFKVKYTTQEDIHFFELHFSK
ncbi:MAG: HAMP domain-containing histidine kinase [Crocinitomicaceae bacterium]|nr:HAMP domain-containing histidine kinase [Crocinitomicaceae bacterium]